MQRYIGRTIHIMQDQKPFIRDIGRIDYDSAYQRQIELQQEVINSRNGPDPCPGYILLLEHVPPVITISKRPEAKEHLLVDAEFLKEKGIELAETDRGGDITYHGPGQIVVYAILDLNRLGLNLRSYMRWLEQIVIDVLEDFGIAAERDQCATGVWVGSEPAAKICAMGVRVSRWVSMHGLALNVEPDLTHFQLIVPCGLSGRPVTCMKMLLGSRCPDISQVKKALADQFLKAVEITLNKQ